jgi:hypothetical protein
VFVALGAALVVRFVTTGGIPMLRMVGSSPPTTPTALAAVITTTELLE